MGFTVDGFNRDKSKMLGAFNKAIADATKLRKTEAESRAAVEPSVEDARTRATDAPGKPPAAR